MLRFKVTLVGFVILFLFAASVVRSAPAQIPVAVGWNALTIPVVPSANYSADNVFSTALEGEALYRWIPNVGAWSVSTYISGVGWETDGGNPAPVFFPGQGIFYFALAAQIFQAPFHGRNFREPAQPVPGNQLLVQNQYYFQGSPTGLSATYEDIFGGPPTNETALFRFIAGGSNIDPTSPDYRVYHYTDGVWSPETPTMNPLEPVFVVHPYLRVKFTLSGNPNEINLSWPRGVLQEAPLPTGPWVTLITAGRTHTISAGAQTNNARFYRARE